MKFDLKPYDNISDVKEALIKRNFTKFMLPEILEQANIVINNHIRNEFVQEVEDSFSYVFENGNYDYFQATCFLGYITDSKVVIRQSEYKWFSDMILYLVPYVRECRR